MLLQESYEELITSDEIYISYEEQCKIKEGVPVFIGENDKDLIDYAKKSGRILKNILNYQAIKKLKNFIQNEKQTQLVIKGFTVENCLPRTPYEGVVDLKSISLSVACHLGIYNILGINPVAYQNENNERLVRHVVPSPNCRHEKSSHGSRLTFGMHVDNPDLALISEPIKDVCASPEFLSLYSLRCDNRVSTDLIVLDEVINRLPKGVIASLKKPLYRVNQPDSFKGGHDGKILPVLVDGGNGLYYCRFDYENISPVSEESAAALYMLRKTVCEVDLVYKQTLLSGDMLIFRNQRTMHSRGGFVPKDSGTDRWLLRIFGVKDMERHLPLSNLNPHIGKTI